jgi:hypothetical protein
MADPNGVKAIHTEATATAVTGRTYLRGYQVLSGGTAGDIIIRDGGAGGVVGVQFNIAPNQNSVVSTKIPGAGILFETNIHVTLPTGAKITMFYQRA